MSKFKTEIDGLHNLIQSAGRYCTNRGYDVEAANAFIDEKCKSYIDIFMPIAAVYPDLYDALMKERPSLKSYLLENIGRHYENKPIEAEIEKELAELLEKNKIFSKGSNANVDLDYFTCVQVIVHKYGFCQEVMSAAGKVDPNLFTMVLRLYDMRIRQAQIVDEEIGQEFR